MTQAHARSGIDARKRPSSDASFFRAVQSYLHNDFKGSLIALILRELGRQEPDAFLRFVADVGLSTAQKREIAGGKAQFTREWHYRSELSSRHRYADLAVLLDGRPVLLFEIKEDDVASKRNPDQLRDYRHYIAHHSDPPIFVHLSRYTPVTALPEFGAQAWANRVHDLRYRHLFAAMAEHVATSHGDAPVARMVHEYLEELGVNKYRYVDLDGEHEALTFLVTQMCGFSHRAGLGRLHSAERAMLGPDLLKRLLGNAAALGEWVAEGNSGLLKRRPTTRFNATRKYRLDRLTVALQSPDEDDGLVSPSPRAVDQGTLTVYASAALPASADRKGSWAYLYLGQFVSVRAGTVERAQVGLFAELEWSGGGHVEKTSDWFTAFPSEAEATVELRKLIDRALGQASKQNDCPPVFDRLKLPQARS